MTFVVMFLLTISGISIVIWIIACICSSEGKRPSFVSVYETVRAAIGIGTLLILAAIFLPSRITEPITQLFWLLAPPIMICVLLERAVRRTSFFNIILLLGATYLAYEAYPWKVIKAILEWFGISY